MDFYDIEEKQKSKDLIHVYPRFNTIRSKDLMVQGGKFLAFFNTDTGLWDTSDYNLMQKIDREVYNAVRERPRKEGVTYVPLTMADWSSGMLHSFRNFCRDLADNFKPFNSSVMFANDIPSRESYATLKLDYSLEDGEPEAWNVLLNTLYAKEERDKIEWAIGSIVAGDSKRIQKFLVFYGPPGSGKSTILNIITEMFRPYTATFDAESLGDGRSSFSTAAFVNNPLVAIQQDGDLSKIKSNSLLNSIVSHDLVSINVKYRPAFAAQIQAMLFVGTNRPIKITDAKSGMLRRLIDVRPTGRVVEVDLYHKLMARIPFEYGRIASACHRRYKEMGMDYYADYTPLQMMTMTNDIADFIDFNYDILSAENGVSLKRAWDLWKSFCDDTHTPYMQMREFREELKNYYRGFEDRAIINGERVRSYYTGFQYNPRLLTTEDARPEIYEIKLDDYDPIYWPSALNERLEDMPAQYAKESGFPGKVWEKVETKLKDIKPERLHFVKVPRNHIVIDFDLVDDDGEKDLEKNLLEASLWPPTYTELSQSGKGVHLHYIYEGDVENLSNVYDVGIEIKTLLGDSSLRRKLTKCNDHDVVVIHGYLPKKEPKMIDEKRLKTEKGLRALIEKNLRKEIHPGTKPSVEFIVKILDDAYNDGLQYDVSDLQSVVFTFAAKSTNHSKECIKMLNNVHWKGQEAKSDAVTDKDEADHGPMVFFDVEVYPNWWAVCFKEEGNRPVQKVPNPDVIFLESLIKRKLVGFNNRRYDNHILFAGYLGWSPEQIYALSQNLINNVPKSTFSEAYNLSYADVFDFSSKKQGLKKFMVELGIPHMEMDIPWDQPILDRETEERVLNYCANDVAATEAVFNARYGDFVARKILSELSGLSVNHSTQNHTAKIIFGNVDKPQKQFVYTDLSTMFPGYFFENGVSTYKGEEVGEGGYVYAEPGMYENVALLDVASMHPTSIEELNLFGPYTKHFSDLKTARMAIKHKDYELARTLLDRKLAPFLVDAEHDEVTTEALSYALKIVINIVYGLTSASFENPFRDWRNKDNIVAKRGALFMIELKNELQNMGVQVVHIKTDSVKIPNATPDIIEFVMKFGRKYGYDFEHEVTYDKFCLVNDAVYIAKVNDDWVAVGAQFQHPYVYKTLFSQEELVFEDYCETKSVQAGTIYKSEREDSEMFFVGSIGRFVPVEEGGYHLWRVKDDKRYAVAGTKGHLWMSESTARFLYDNGELKLDMSYFYNLADAATKTIQGFGDFQAFVN